MSEKFSDDLLDGAAEIGEFLGMPTRRVFYCAENGLLPLFKIGHRWTGLKSELRAHYSRLSNHAVADPANSLLSVNPTDAS